MRFFIDYVYGLLYRAVFWIGRPIDWNEGDGE